MKNTVIELPLRMYKVVKIITLKLKTGKRKSG